MIIIRTLALGIAAALSMTSFVVTASAAEPTIETRAVTYADLNLNAPDGRATLQKRIDRAATAVCVSLLDGTISIENRQAFKRCHDEAVANTTRQLASATSNLRFASH